LELAALNYSFTGKFLDRGGIRLHYLDEGSGEPIVMLHGNPTWSFFYRNLILALRQTHRCIVPDHIGCGLSDKPDPTCYDYSLRSRIDDVEALLDHLQIRERITLVVHDWGGMIGMGFATRHPERIARIVAMNTGAFHLPKSKKLPLSLWLGRNTVLGSWLIRRFNLFCRCAARWCVTRRPLSPEVRAAYLAPYDSWQNRIAVLRFVQTIPLRAGDPGYDMVSSVEDGLKNFLSIPVFLGWGMRDFVFDEHFLAEWQRHFPQAEVHRWEDAGHYLLEDAGEEVIPLIKGFVNRGSQGALESGG
jgi:haloalkane dehalogenase